MSNILVTLLGGVAVIALVFIILYQVTQMSGKMVATVMAFAVIGTYVPVAIFTWPGADVFAIHIALYMVSVYILGIITSQRDSRRLAGETGLGFHWAPAAIVIFFIILIIMDSFFVMFATRGMDHDLIKKLLPEPQSGAKVSSNFPGTVSHNYHEKQAQYNEYLRRFEAQKLRNWHVRKGWLGDAIVNKPAIFRVEIRDKNQQPVTGARVKGTFMRPSNSKLDIEFAMQEIEPGVYQQSLTFPKPGSWDLVLKIDKGDAIHEIRATTSIEDVSSKK